MTSKNQNKPTSDEILKQQMAALDANDGDIGDLDTSALTGGPKTNVTLSEALAESGETLEDLTGANAKKAATKRVTKRAAKNDGDAPALTTPRPRIIPGSTPSQVLAQHLNDTEKLNAACILETGDEPSEANTAGVGAIMDRLAKKIGEKAVNVLRNRDNFNSLQVYTRVGIEQLIAKGSMTGVELTKHFNETKYSIGTARAQSNQIMTLLPAMKIATMTTKGTIEVNPKSAILASLNLNK